MWVTSPRPRGSDSCAAAPFPVVVAVGSEDGGVQMLGCRSLLHSLDGAECIHAHVEVLASVWSFDVDMRDGAGDGVVVEDILVGSDLYEGLLQTAQVEVAGRSFFVCLFQKSK